MSDKITLTIVVIAIALTITSPAMRVDHRHANGSVMGGPDLPPPNWFTKVPGGGRNWATDLWHQP
jgi:hypothetical protein